ncbi:MAG: ABC transporter ATP-binding protein [Phycisphaerae bacterium]|nr:ABC transporter ATP-binding protein [Gemmatimonadaceae bacterium]
MPNTSGIRFEGIWKKFRRGEVHNSLRDLVPAMVRRTFAGRAQPSAVPQQLGASEFWALRDVSFTVEPGQCVGVIGQNGAGKSTLLKVLTRILRPNRGTYHVDGRIGALLEIAAGFHPDLNGRENIYLQGAIMGMDQRHIQSKFDEIVAFSEIESFIETPVKRYSSGMNARLGFSIAAHLDPDVLIIDEVLAVGDYTFQRKAFGRIRDLARSGMPVVVVSHQLDRIAELCTAALLLTAGAVTAQGSPASVIGAYLRGSTGEGAPSDASSPLRIDSAEFVGSGDVLSGGVVHISIRGDAVGTISRHIEPVGILVRSAQSGEIVYATGSSLYKLEFAIGAFVLDVQLQMNVQPGIYLLEIGVFDRADERALALGPTLNVRVLESTTYLGVVNLNAQMRFDREPAHRA